MRAQGRDESYIKDFISAKLRKKGCQENALQVVFRVSQGPGVEPKSIYRCPRAIALDHDIACHFSEYFRHRDCGIVVHSDSRPWKWHQIMLAVRSEILSLEKNWANNNA